MHYRRFWAPLLFASLATAVVADEGHQHHAAGGKLGSVNFETSCDKSVQKDFERSVAMLHSFWYDEAEKAFNAVAQKDPACAMAYWGVAMSRFHPLWAPPSKADVEQGKAAIAKARAAKHTSDRERAWVEAIARVYEAPDGATLPERDKAWLEGMKKVREVAPKDSEAEIYTLLATMATVPPTDKTHTTLKEVGARLEQIWDKQPQHPGLAHYIIHTYDRPALAQYGVNAARKYARIAPSAPHALHMPSHIFTRLGMWEDSVRSNTDSANAARANYKKSGSPLAVGEQMHAMDYLTYAYLQRGEIQPVKALLDELKQIANADYTNFAASYASASMPARYTMETRRWAEARDLPEPTFSGGTFWTEVANSIAYWARALGAARTGQVERARADIAQIEKLRDKLAQAKRQEGADTIEVMRLSAAAWTAFAAGEKDEALRLMRASADLEDRTDKHPVSPGAVLPAREQLGDMLAESGKPAEAVAEYEASLKVAPNRFNSVQGAARAAEAAGNRAKARQYYARLLEIAPQADAELVRDARKFLEVATK